MKNKKYIIGLVCSMLIITSSIMKILHWPGAGPTLTLGILMLAGVFVPLALISSFKDAGKKRWSLYLAAFFTLTVDFVGALFKIMHWPGAGIMLFFGITLPVTLFLPVYLYHHYREKEESLQGFMFIMGLLVYLSVMSALLALNVSKNLLDDAVRTSQLMENSRYLELKRQFGEKGLAHNQQLESLNKQANDLENYIHSLKTEIVICTSEDNKAVLEANMDINPWNLKGGGEYQAFEGILFGENGNVGKAVELKQKIKKYHDYILTEFELGPSSRQFVAKLLDTEKIKDGDGDLVLWEEYYFSHVPMAFALDNLGAIQNQINLAQNEAVMSITPGPGM